uniref:Protein-lysine N-methyltransferase EEF2KMT n=1 Tax=Cacopsylla melanoneura TaxID=428564 RepID=A0A8D8XK65_9HEMI
MDNKDNLEEKLFSSIQKSFFLLEPVDNFLIDLLNLNKEFNQEKLISSTINHDIIQKYPNKIDYTIRYLRQVISLLEYNGVEVLESIYNKYVLFLKTKSEEKLFYYRHFIINNQIVIIKNTYSMISRGTTGLCVWEGAMVLAEWCLQNKNILQDKIILELGCGVGFSGLVAIKNCKCKHYIFSDCNNEVLQTLEHNVHINIKHNDLCLKRSKSPSKNDTREVNEVGDVLTDLINKVRNVDVKTGSEPNDTIETKIDKKDIGTYQDTLISIQEATFQDISLIKSNDRLCDIVLASDIVYDTDLFPSLRNALLNIFKHNENCTAVFACKVRNMDTYKSFVDILNETKKFHLVEEQLKPENLFFFSDKKMYSMVKILIIKQNNTT